MLQEREWECSICGIHHDRGQNAALNLVNLLKLPQELREVPMEKRDC